MSDLPTDEARQALAGAPWTDDERMQMANCIEHIATDQRYSTEAVGLWVRNNLRELLASLRAKTAGGAGKWQPIESAPKDGSWCIFTSTWNKYARWVGQWERNSWMDQFECESDLSEFTHWTPLLDPPLPLDPSPPGEGGGA